MSTHNICFLCTTGEIYPTIITKYSQTCVKQAPMGKPKLVACLIRVDFLFFVFNGI